MNEFTKEELQEIHKAYSHYYKHVYEGDIEPCQMIFNKIESLIDNYCDHELILSKYMYGVDEHVYRCKKCLKIYEKLE